MNRLNEWLRSQSAKAGMACICLLLLMIPANAQQKNTAGIIVDEETGEPLTGASIMVKDTRQGCISDIDGRFTFPQPLSEQQSLVVSYIGYVTVEVPVRHRWMEIRLRQSVNKLDEVIVQVAYGTASRKSITGAVSVVDSKQIDMRPVNAVTSVLNGLVPGVQVIDGIGQPGAEATVRIRGFSSVNGTNEPLYVVDGMPYTGWKTDINPADIESVSVLKDAASCALYGSRASNGVILITTKRAKQHGLSLRLDIRHGFNSRGQNDYERMNPDQFMETIWQGYRNELITGTKYTPEQATLAANSGLIANKVGINIYNKADDALFDENGHLVADAQIAEGYRDDLDWYAPYTRTGHRQEYNLSGEAGNEKNRFRFSLGYLDEDGYSKKNNFNRLSGQVSADFSPTRWLKAGMAVAGNTQETEWDMGALPSAATSQTNAFYFARRIAPVFPVHLHYAQDITGEDGSLLHAKGDYMLDDNGNKQYDDGTQSRTGDSPSRGYHLLWETEKNKLRTSDNTLQGNAYTDIAFLHDFTFSLKGNISLRNLEDRQYRNAEVGQFKGIGYLSLINQKIQEYTLQQMLTWQRSFGKHWVEWMIGHENYDYRLNYARNEKQNESFPGIDQLTNFSTTKANTGFEDTYRTEGYFTRTRYNYGDTYFAEASFRRDGSSIFHKDHRWGNFWSAGIGWMISTEAFMKGIRWIDRLKLRLSYGQVGNDNFLQGQLHQWMGLYGASFNGGEGAYYKMQNENPELKWETSSSLNIGLEARLLNRINLSFEYFDKRSDDLLFLYTRPLSAGATNSTSGTSTVWRNIGNVSNRGWEFSIDADFLRTRNWEWNVGLSLSKIKNKIGKLPDKDRKEGILSGDYQKLMEGHSIYDFWLYQYAGVDQLTGRSLYLPDLDTYYIAGTNGAPVNENEDTNGKTAIKPANWVEINGQYYIGDPKYGRKDWSGSALPKINGALNTSLRWKDLTLSALMIFSCGSKVLDLPYQELTSIGVHSLSTDLLNAWVAAPEGMAEDSPNRLDPNGIPQVNSEATINGYNIQKVSTRYITSGNYLSLKNVTLAYRLPATWSRKLTISDIRVHAAIENAALFSKRKGLNPIQTFNGIVSNYTSIARTFSFGVSIYL